MDSQNSFTAAKSGKFPTTPVVAYPPDLKYVAALPWKTQNTEICNFHARKTRFKLELLRPPDFFDRLTAAEKTG